MPRVKEGYSHSVNLDVVDRLIGVNDENALKLLVLYLKIRDDPDFPPMEPIYQKGWGGEND